MTSAGGQLRKQWWWGGRRLSPTLLTPVVAAWDVPPPSLRQRYRSPQRGCPGALGDKEREPRGGERGFQADLLAAPTATAVTVGGHRGAATTAAAKL